MLEVEDLEAGDVVSPTGSLEGLHFRGTRGASRSGEWDIPDSCRPVGGRLSGYLHEWEKITDCGWTLHIIEKGYRIPFHSTPPLRCTPLPCVLPRDTIRRDALQLEVQSLLEKQAVEEVLDVASPGFYSRLFVVPKKNGKLRPVLDLSKLNQFVQADHFKMETARSIRDTVQVNDWAVSIDLRDAYLHVPIARPSRKYLRFSCEGRTFQFRVLPFGISTAPRVFTKLMEVVAAAARREGASLLQYLDDWILHQQSRSLLLNNLQHVWSLITRLGLIPNLEKSDLIPTQDFTYVGMNFLTSLGIVRVPPDRL